MPLSRLENFLINTDGNILYVNPSDLDATDSFDNKGNSLTRPFRTIQRALIEAARFAYQSGSNNDRFDRTTILLYPGTHVLDNRPGLFIKNNGGTAQYFDVNESVVPSPNIELTNTSIFDINNASNVLYKFNSVDGGVIVPKGTSIVGLDLRKTKIRPLYVPDPEDDTIPRSALFRITGACYFWQFSLFDANQAVFYNKNFGLQRDPSYSHHKLTCFEYADGINKKTLTGLSDLEMYYFKLMNAYGATTGNRQIGDYPINSDFEPNNPEFRIVGNLVSDDLILESLVSVGKVATATTKNAHGLTIDDPIRVTGINSTTYNGSFQVTGITSERNFTYSMLSDPDNNVVNFPGEVSNPRVIVESDSVTGASPYIFNLSLRSVFGMCGMHADGSKATGFKSMVVAQFTGIGLQKDPNAFIIYNEDSDSYDNNANTTASKPLYTNQDAVYKPNYENFHVRASNDSVIQAVSVFAIGFAQHFLAESGADQSITNSNSNFGAKSLVSKGFRKESFNRDDTGYITHIVPPKDLQEKSVNVVWRSLDPIKTNTGTLSTSRLYLLGETDKSNPPANVTAGYRVGSGSNEILYLDLNLNGVPVSVQAPIFMEGGTSSGKKESDVKSVDAGANQLILTQNHEFITGESVRVYSEDGIVPGGIESGNIYYAIVSNSTTIQLASSLDDALSGTVIDIKNTAGGLLRVCSNSTDKLPGEIGHPIQYDNAKTNWFINSSNDPSVNTIHAKFVTDGTAISENNSSAYFKRVPENRNLTDRIYKLRYVIPKDISSIDAKAPAKNFILQESKTTEFQGTFGAIKESRNPRIIAGISTVGDVVTVTTEKFHGLSVNDRVRIKKVKSTENADGSDTSGFNGYYTVTGITGARQFTYTYDRPNVAGDFDASSLDTLSSDLPSFERNEYDTTYTIQDVETIQEYIKDQQDGVYYLTCLIGNISPTVSNFNSLKLRQNETYLYPTVDKDNFDVDPNESVSSASNKTIGKVLINDPQNSVTKESIINYISDNKVGFAITNAISSASGISTITFDINHTLNRVKKLTVSTSGSGYTNGTYRNVVLGNTGSAAGSDATATIVVSGGSISSVELVNPGSGYAAGDILSVSIGGGTNGRVTVNSIVNSIGDTLQVVGVGVTENKITSGYNGLYKITDIPSPKSIAYNNLTNPGIYTATSKGTAFTVGLGLTVNNVNYSASAGTVTITTNQIHDLSVGNKVKILGITGIGSTYFNGDFIVKTITAGTSFSIGVSTGITTSTGFNSAEVYKYGLHAYGQDTTERKEKISGSLISMNTGYRMLIQSGSNGINDSATSFTVNNSDGLERGSFVQVEDEIMRISNATSTTLTVLRGVLGSKRAPHGNNSVIKQINVVPSEVRRFSILRASGHTFEYVGYGPGNYSTSLPQRIRRILTEEEELLCLSKEEDGGIVFFSGMNDRGDFFTGQRPVPTERFLGDVDPGLTGIFDDLYVRNTLRVGGGPNRNLPSEFRGPVNFTNKITSTDPVDGINAIKLLLQGTVEDNPFFQVGPDANPSLIVKDDANAFVGIKKANPAFELDVNGTIRAENYENFELTDLPIGVSEEPTYDRNRVLKVKDDGSGYELVDIHELDAYKMLSYGISVDPTVYTGTPSIVSSKLRVSGISTNKFYVGENVKIFGATLSSDSATIPTPVIATASTIAQTGITTTKTYRYWTAEYHLTNGKVGVSSESSVAIGHIELADFNDQNHVALTLGRSSTNNGILVYRSINNPSQSNAKLIAILGNKELSNSTSGIVWQDYGNYDQTAWNGKGTSNEFLDTGDRSQIHFPNRASANPGRGWAIDKIVEVGTNSITVQNNYNFNNGVGFGTANQVKVVHDSTAGLSTAITEVTEAGGNYLNLPSGTIIFNKLVIPDKFTIRGNGKNTTLLRQYFGTDAADGEGNDLTSGDFAEVKFIGIANTCKDITISDLTIDGNNVNNVLVDEATSGQGIDNYMVNLRYIESSLIKDVELRNSSGSGLYLHDSTRVSIENSTFVDGSLTDRYPYQPISAQNSGVLRVNDSLFENFPGPVDLSVTSVVSTGGNIIRNCGTGLRTFATGKITTTNNIILGPADEFIPSPDIFDSDFNSVNITIDKGQNFETPVYLYVEKGDPKDVSTVAVQNVSLGIGTIVGQGTTNEYLLDPFLSVVPNNPNIGEPEEFTRNNGYLQFGLNSSQTNDSAFDPGKPLGYKVTAEEFINPVGYSTIGIGTGRFINAANGNDLIGAGATTYLITLDEKNDFPAFTVGDVVKLVNHTASPGLEKFELTIAEKINVSANIKRLKLVGFTTTSINHGDNNGYILVRNKFVIAKGRVGVI